jgi:hypothetical protein
LYVLPNEGKFSVHNFYIALNAIAKLVYRNARPSIGIPKINFFWNSL